VNGHRVAAHWLLSLLLLQGSLQAAAEDDAGVAYLKNRYERQGASGFAYLFQFANGERLSSGFWSLERHGPRDLVHEIPAGETVLGLRINYFEISPGYPYAADTPDHWRIIVRDRGGMKPNARMTGEERSFLRARSGIRIDARAGRTYQIACKIKDGHALVWIEDVTDGDDPTVVSDVLYGLNEWGLSGQNWYVWTNLPDSPVYQRNRMSGEQQ